MLGVLSLSKVLLERYLVFGNRGSVAAIVFDASVVAVIFGLGLLFSTEKRMWRWFVFSSVLTSVIMLITVVYASFFDQIVSPDAIGMAGQVGEVGNAVFELLSLKQVLLFIDVPLIIWLALRARRSGGADRALSRRSRLVVGLLLLAVIGTLGQRVRIISTEPGPLDGMNVGSGMGIFAYQLASGFHEEDLSRTLVQVSGDVHPEDSNWVMDAIATLKGTGTGERLHGVSYGVAAGSNVICIQVEALQTSVVGEVIDGHPLTSNLDELIAESWYFPQTFSQLSAGNTSDAEFVAATSLYPPSNAAASVEYSSFQIPGLPRILGEQGYDTFTLHTNDATFWNRTQMYPSVGYDRYYDLAFFGEEDKIRMGASDEVLFRRGLEVLLEDSEADVPFYAHFVTLTSHFPFEQLPDSKDPYEPPAPYADTVVGSYLSHVDYADRCLGEFLDELKRTGLYDSSIIVIYGDHFGIPYRADATDDEKAAQQALLGREYTLTDRLMVPLIIHLPGQTQGGTSLEVAAQMDIMPTIADLLGVDISDVPHFGRSVFTDEPILVGMRRYIREGSVATSGSLVYAGLDAESSYTVPLDSRLEQLTPTAAELEALEVTRSLLALSDTYTRMLPTRADYDPDAEAFIPNK